MAENSFFVRYFWIIFTFLNTVYEESMFYSIYHRIGHFLKRKIDNSFIMNFLKCRWERFPAVSPRKSYLFTWLNRLNGVTERFWKTGTGVFARQAQESRILSFLSQNFMVFLLYLLFFVLPFLPTMLLALLCAGILAVYAVNVAIGRMRLRMPELLGVFVGLFALCYIYAGFTSYNFPKSLEVLTITLCFVLMFFVTSNLINTERKFYVLLNLFILSGTLIALYAIYQYMTGVEMDAAWVDAKSFDNIRARAYATFNNPNVLGEYLIILTSLGVGMLWMAKGFFAKCFYAVLCGLMALGLAATNSRGAMMGLLLSAGFFVLLSEKRMILLGIIGLCMLPFILPDVLWERIASVATLTDSSSLYRMSIYKASMNILENYWISGIGLDAFSLIYPLFSYEAAYAYHSHNLFLQELIELGVIGFSMFAGSLLLFFQKLYYGIHHAKKEYRYMLGAIFGGFAGVLLQGMVDHLWFDYRIILLFWLVMGLGMAAVKIGVRAAHDRK